MVQAIQAYGKSLQNAEQYSDRRHRQQQENDTVRVA